jgi:hypothetical protein
MGVSGFRPEKLKKIGLEIHPAPYIIAFIGQN